MYIILALLILCVIIIFHEFGHYLVGRLCGIEILEFAVGFGPKLFSRTRKGIEYSVRALPLGGFCRFQDDDSPRAMNNVSVWKRIATVFAGPLMNFIVAYLAAVIMLCVFSFGTLTPRIAEVSAGMPAETAGLCVGDTITQANGEAITPDYDGVVRLRELLRSGGTIDLTVDRNGTEQQVTVEPASVTDEETGESVYRVGITFDVSYRSYSLLEAIPGAAGYMVDCTKQMLDFLRRLIFRFEGAENVSGVVGTVVVISDAVRSDARMIWDILFVISLNLGIMNLLPFPGLDGGRLIFLLIEAVRGKPVPQEKEGMVHFIGLALLMGLAVLLIWHDLITYVF